MGTVIIINRSTLTDSAASGYGERRKFLVTEEHPADRAFKGRKPDE